MLEEEYTLIRYASEPLKAEIKASTLKGFDRTGMSEDLGLSCLAASNASYKAWGLVGDVFQASKIGRSLNKLEKFDRDEEN